MTENCLNVKNDFIVALKVESVLIHEKTLHFNMWAKGVRDLIMISWKSAVAEEEQHCIIHNTEEF